MHLLMTLTDFTHPQNDHCYPALLLSWQFLCPSYHHCRCYLVAVTVTGLVCEVLSLDYPGSTQHGRAPGEVWTVATVCIDSL